MVDHFENVSVASDTPEPNSPGQGSVNTANTADTANTEADETYDHEAVRPFIAPSKCYGFKWVRSKGLTLCPKNARATNKFAFCGKAHQDAFQQSGIHPSLQQLFYHFVAIVNDTRQDLEDQFSRQVVPYFILLVAQSRKYRNRRPVFLTFQDLDDAYEFQNDALEYPDRNLRDFYQLVREDLRRYLRNIAPTLTRSPDEWIAEWDRRIQNLEEREEIDFSEITFRYLIDPVEE